MRYLEIRVLELVQRGITDNKVIARKLNCHISTPLKYRKQHRCSNLRGPAAHDARARAYGFPDAPAAIRGWAEAGLTNEAIAARLGCYAPRVSRYIRDMGGVVRPAGRGRQHK